MYEDGAIAEELAEAFAERCRAGVGVSILLDATGSSQMPKRLRERMSTAGCHVEMFHPLSAFAIKRVNHRNHRRILVVDGRVGFIGGTGVGTNWTGDGKTSDHWRQTDVRVEGPVVRALQAAFAEPWRETTGLLLGGDAYFPDIPGAGRLSGQAVKSSPVGGAAEAYMLFLLAIDGARSSIRITNPYFVPDTPMMDAMERAVARGVRVEVITAGEASTTLDRRSFALDHELNLAFDDPGLARELERIFADDLTRTHGVTLAQWRKRGVGRLLEIVVLPLRDEL